MAKNTLNAIDVDALLRHTAEFDNAALPFDSWKSRTLAVASKTPEHEAELLLAFEERIKRKKKRIATLTMCGSAAAVIVLMVTVHLGTMNKSFSMDNAAPQEARMEAAALDPGAGDKPELFMAAGGADAEREDGIDDLLIAEAPQAASMAPEEAAVPVPEPDTRMFGASVEEDAIEAVIKAATEAVTAYSGVEAAVASSEFFAGGSYMVRRGESESAVLVTLDAAYVVTLESGARYVVSVPDMELVAELVE